jgi:hypothetical protein
VALALLTYTLTEDVVIVKLIFRTMFLEGRRIAGKEQQARDQPPHQLYQVFHG